MLNLGKVKPGSTIYIPFDSFAGASGNSITASNFATSDILIYKDGGTTQRASVSGYTLLDTDGIDFDGTTGIHGFSIDLSNNDTADFYAAGSKYFIVVGPITIDSQTVNFLAANFNIGYEGSILDTTIATLASQTSFTLTTGPTDNNALIGCVALVHDAASAVQVALGVVSAYTGASKTVTLAADPGIFTMAAKDNISFFPAVNSKFIGQTVQTAGDVYAKTVQTYSDTTIITSDIVLIDAAISDIQSDTNKLISDVTKTQLSDIKAETAKIYSDTAIIYSDTTLITADTTKIYSDTTLVVADTTKIYSDTTAIHAQTTKINSDITKTSLSDLATASILSDVQSDTNKIISDLTKTSISDLATASILSDVQSDTNKIVSDLVKTAISDLAIATELAKVYSDTTIIYSDTTIIETSTNLLSDIQSDTNKLVSDVTKTQLSDIKAETVKIYSDTTIVSSDTTAIHTQTTKIESDLVKTALSDLATASILSDVQSDTNKIVSDLTKTAISDLATATGLVGIYSDTTIIESAAGLLSDIQSDTNKLVSDVTKTQISDIKAETTKIYSDTTIIASDIVIIDSSISDINSDTNKIISDLIKTPISDLATATGLTSVYSDTTIAVANIGTPTALDGGAATLGGMLTKMADDNNGSTFDATYDSLNKVKAAVVSGTAATLQATANTETTGSLIGGTYAATYLSNGTYWITAPVTPAVGGFGLNVYLTFTAAADQYISSVTIRGYFASGPTRAVEVWAYNYITDLWDQLSDSTTRMNNASTNQLYTYILLSSHRKSNGEVKIRFTSTSTTTGDRLNIDQCLVNVQTAGSTAADIAEAVKQKLIVMYYSDGVWYDDIAGESGVIIGTNGISTNPSNNYTELMEIANILGVKRVYLKPGSTLTLAQNHDNWRFIGAGEIELASQSIANTVFEDIYRITGTGTGDDIEFTRCGIGNTTLEHCYMRGCFIKGTINLAATNDYHLLSCADAINIGTSTLVFASGSNVYMRDWRGGIQLNNMISGSECIIDGAGRVVIDSGCTGGDIVIRGHFPELTGDDAFITAGGTISQTARYSVDYITNEVISDIGISGQNLSGIPWNSAWDAEVQSECADALTAYDPPTNAEMEARTLSSGDYFNYTNDSGNLVDAVWNGINQSVIDSIFSTYALTEDYPATGVAATPAQIMYLMMQSLHEFGISGTLRSVKQLDGNTIAAEFTLDSATAPTSTTRTA